MNSLDQTTYISITKFGIKCQSKSVPSYVEHNKQQCFYHILKSLRT